jgi:hypothetical protein
MWEREQRYYIGFEMCATIDEIQCDAVDHHTVRFDIPGLPSLLAARLAAVLFTTVWAADHVGLGSGAFSTVLYVALLGVTCIWIVALPSLYVLVGVPSVM